MIDLAGSEKATEDTDRRKEGAFINKSLLTLGTVISKITDGSLHHIPFRDSKLTRLLQSSLLGHSRITVIATISPNIDNFEETVNTLKFAQRAKRITGNLEVNVVMDDRTIIRKYRADIQDLNYRLDLATVELEQERLGNKGLEGAERDKYESKIEKLRLVFLLDSGKSCLVGSYLASQETHSIIKECSDKAVD